MHPRRSLLLCAMVWSVFFAVSIGLYPHFGTIGDDVSYLDSARMLYLEGIFSDARPVVISAVFGFPYLCGATDATVVTWGLAFNYVLWLGSALLVFNTASLITSRRTAFLAALALLSCVGVLANAFNFLSEPLYIFLNLAAVRCAAGFSKTGKPWYLSFALAALLLNALVKPVAVALAIVLAIVYVKHLKAAITNWGAATIALAAFLIGVQMRQMKATYGDYTLSYIDAITYYNYLGARADCYAKGIPFIPGENDRAKHFQSFPSHIQKKMAQRDMAEQFRHNTLNLARAYVFCLHSNSSKGSFIISQAGNPEATLYGRFFKFWWKALSKLQNILLTIVGVALSVLAFVRRSNPLQRMLAGFTLAIIGISAMSCYQTDRFHIAIYPLVILMAATEYRVFVGSGRKP